MKVIFKVSNPKDSSIASLLKQVNKFVCRIQLDIENGFVTVENVTDEMIDSIIELIDNYYTILGVDIDNSVEDDSEIIDETSATNYENNLNSDSEAVSNLEINSEIDSESEIVQAHVGPQSADDLIIDKVEFKNECIEQLINKLLRTIYWAMFKMEVSEKEIEKFLWSSIREISMQYSWTGTIDFCIGDIVDCNYGMHLTGEINGSHTNAIVCHISNYGMVYLVPITKVQEHLSSHSYLRFTVPEDVEYFSLNYSGGTALLDKGKYVRSERLQEVVGKTTPEFFALVLNQLAHTFDFTDSILKTETKSNENQPVEDVNSFSDISATEIMNKTNFSTNESFPEDQSKVAGKKDEKKSNSLKKGSEESALLVTLDPAFEMLDPTKPIEEQLDTFLSNIKMPRIEMIRNSFIVAVSRDIKKITFENVIAELRKDCSTLTENDFKSNLKEHFKRWLTQYPELAEKCPRISFVSLLKTFARRFG